MSTLSIQPPDSIRQRVEFFAREDVIGVDAFVAPVPSRRIAVAEADSSVRRRAAQGSARQMLGILEIATEGGAGGSGPNWFLTDHIASFASVNKQCYCIENQ